MRSIYKPEKQSLREGAYILLVRFPSSIYLQSTKNVYNLILLEYEFTSRVLKRITELISRLFVDCSTCYIWSRNMAGAKENVET